MAATITRMVLTLGSLLLGVGLAAAQQLALERASVLYAEPSADAAVIAKLKSGTKGEAIGKQGPWLNVQTDAGTGWLLSFDVRYAADGSGSARPSAPRQRPGITSTIGIRGLDEEDLKHANFDAQQMSLLERYAASKADGENAARASGLAAVRLDYFGR